MNAMEKLAEDLINEICYSGQPKERQMKFILSALNQAVQRERERVIEECAKVVEKPNAAFCTCNDCKMREALAIQIRAIRKEPS